MQNLIYGFHSIISRIESSPQSIEVIYLDSKRQDKRSHELCALAQAKNVALKLVSSSELSTLSKTTTHQGVAATVQARPPADFKSTLARLSLKEQVTILVLDGITDPQNLGAIIRTADCFGVDALILPKNNSATPDNPIVAKVSSGAVNNLAIITVNNLNQALDTLKENEFWIAGAALTKNSVNLFDFKFKGKIVWVMGNEGSGMRRLVTEHCDYLVTIPMRGQTESLNVSVATGVVLAYTNFMQDINI